MDESLGIDWRIPTEHANLSEKDTKHEVPKDFESPFTKRILKKALILVSVFSPQERRGKTPSGAIFAPPVPPLREGP